MTGTKGVAAVKWCAALTASVIMWRFVPWHTWVTLEAGSVNTKGRYIDHIARAVWTRQRKKIRFGQAFRLGPLSPAVWTQPRYNLLIQIRKSQIPRNWTLKFQSLCIKESKQITGNEVYTTHWSWILMSDTMLKFQVLFLGGKNSWLIDGVISSEISVSCCQNKIYVVQTVISDSSGHYPTGKVFS